MNSSEKPYTGHGTSFYVTTDEVARTVNLAIQLRRPILVEGEPGCGKTMLAYSIAAEKELGDPIKISVKSTSRASDLLYRMDALRRLHDSQTRENPEARFVYPYISLEPFGEAIWRGQRRVVLIDEVDKADIDFPNDLLDVLDRFEFQIDVLPYHEESESPFPRTIRLPKDVLPPIVVITSNREKRLPEPFLRRCLYIRLRFPQTPEELRTIVEKNLALDEIEVEYAVIDATIRAFLRIRSIALRGEIQKPPALTELIDWVKIVHWQGENPQNMDNPLPPYWETLFKNMQDLDQLERMAKQAK